MRSHYLDQKDQIRFMRLLMGESDSKFERSYAATYEEIAEEMGMTRQGVEQTEKVALFKFREAFKQILFDNQFDIEV